MSTFKWWLPVRWLLDSNLRAKYVQASIHNIIAIFTRPLCGAHSPGMHNCVYALDIRKFFWDFNTVQWALQPNCVPFERALLAVVSAAHVPFAMWSCICHHHHSLWVQCRYHKYRVWCAPLPQATIDARWAAFLHSCYQEAWTLWWFRGWPPKILTLHSLKECVAASCRPMTWHHQRISHVFSLSASAIATALPSSWRCERECP